MLRQRCKLKDLNGIYHWVKGIDRNGDIEFTDIETDGLILLNQHWSELIKRQDLIDQHPHLVDVQDQK